MKSGAERIIASLLSGVMLFSTVPAVFAEDDVTVNLHLTYETGIVTVDDNKNEVGREADLYALVFSEDASSNATKMLGSNIVFSYDRNTIVPYSAPSYSEDDEEYSAPEAVTITSASETKAPFSTEKTIYSIEGYQASSKTAISKGSTGLIAAEWSVHEDEQRVGVNFTVGGKQVSDGASIVPGKDGKPIVLAMFFFKLADNVSEDDLSPSTFRLETKGGEGSFLSEFFPAGTVGCAWKVSLAAKSDDELATTLCYGKPDAEDQMNLVELKYPGKENVALDHMELTYDTIVDGKITVKGETQTFTPTVKLYDADNNLYTKGDKVPVYTVEKLQNDTPVSGAVTGVTVPEGVLTVTNQAESVKVRVTATCGKVSDSVDVTITRPEPELTSISLNKDTVSVDGTNGGEIIVTAKDQLNGDLTSGLSYAVTLKGTSSNPPASGDDAVTVANGVITVGKNAAEGVYTVTVTQGSKELSKDFTVSRGAGKATSIQIQDSGQKTVKKPLGDTPATATYTAKVYDQFDREMTAAPVTWEVSKVAGVSIDANGVLTVTKEAAAGNVTVTAKSGDVSDTFSVSITSLSFIYNGNPLSDSNSPITPVASPTYGQTWGEILGLSSAEVEGITAMEGSNVIDGLTYGVKEALSEFPEAGEQSYHVVVTSDGEYKDLVVYTGTVTVTKKVLKGVLTLDTEKASNGSIVSITAVLTPEDSAVTESDYDIIWMRNDKVIDSASGTSYSVQSEDRGQIISAKAVGKGSYEGEIVAGNPVNLPSTSDSSAAPPDAPKAPTVSAGDAIIRVSWSAPADNGSPITGYTLYYAPQIDSDSFGESSEVKLSSSDSTSYVISGVKNGTTYSVWVVATNAIGNSFPSEKVTAKPAATGNIIGGGGGSSSGGGIIGGGSGSGSGSSQETPPENFNVTAEPKKEEDNSYVVDLPSDVCKDIEDKAGKTHGGDVTIDVPAAEDAKKVTATIPTSTVKNVADRDIGNLNVKTPLVEVRFPKHVLGNLGSTTGKNVSIAAERDDNGSIFVNVDSGSDTFAKTMGKGTVAVIVNPDETETPIRPSALMQDGTIATLLDKPAVIKIVENSKDFHDVPADYWGADSIAFAYSHDLFRGVGDDMFAPEDNMTRGMLVTVLFRLGGEKKVDKAAGFNDLDQDWYKDAVNWACELEIAQGTGEGEFSPNEDITRESLCLMLYRYAKKLGLLDKGNISDLADFSDIDGISDFAKEAIAWCVGSGIVNGIPAEDGKLLLNSTDGTSRVEVAAMLERFVRNVLLG